MSNVAGKQVFGFAGHLGGWKAFEPVASIALEKGCHVFMFLVGTCADLYNDGKLNIDPRIQVFADRDGCTITSCSNPFFYLNKNIHLLVVCASQSNVGRDALLHLTSISTAPILIIEDMYRSAHGICRMLAHDLTVQNRSTVCVIDAYAKKDLQEEVPAVDSNNVVVTGGPQFDRDHGFKDTWDKNRASARAFIGIHDDTLVFLIVGGVTGTVDMMITLDLALKRMGISNRNPKVFVRLHPRQSSLDRELVIAMIGNDRFRYFHVDEKITKIRRLPPIATENFLPMVDFVLSPFSTANHHAILFGMPGTIYVGTPSIKQQMWEEKKLYRWPTVENDPTAAAWYVETVEHLAHAITETLKGDASTEVERIKANQRKLQEANDGKAAKRVWDECVKLMTGSKETEHYI